MAGLRKKYDVQCRFEVLQGVWIDGGEGKEVGSRYTTEIM
jgi:hypothetical protein